MARIGRDDPALFCRMLVQQKVVSEKELMDAYGFTHKTFCWITRISNIGTAARRYLKEFNITLPRAEPRVGWSLATDDRNKLKTVLGI